MFNRVTSSYINGTQTHKCLITKKDANLFLKFLMEEKNNPNAFSFESDGSADASLVCTMEDLDISLFPKEAVSTESNMAKVNLMKVNLMFDVRTMEYFDIAAIKMAIEEHLNPKLPTIPALTNQRGNGLDTSQNSWSEFDYDAVSNALLLSSNLRMSYPNRKYC